MTAPAKAAPMREDVTQERPINEHPCHGLFVSAGDRLTHRHWFQDNAVMPTCERCGTLIDRDHKEIGPVSWQPEKRREVVTLTDRHAISTAAMDALGEWLAWPDAGRDGPREVTVQQTLSFLRGLPNRLGYGARTARPDAGDEDVERYHMALFAASDRACHLYPGEDQQKERAAFCEGAALVAVRKDER